MKKFEKIFLFLLIFGFACGFSLVSILRHSRFESFAYDLGIYDQAIWLFSHFKSPFSTIKNSHIFGDHLIPALYFLSPIYWFFDEVAALLLFQAIWVATGAIPIYLLAKEKLKNVFLSFVLAFCFLSFFGIQNGIAFDFHPLLIAVPLITWWLYFLEKGKRLKVFLLSLVILGLQENLGLLLIALGFVVLIQKKDKAFGAIIILLASFWFLLATKVLMPYFSSQDTFSYFPTKPFLVPQNFFKELFYPFEKTKTIFVSLGAFAFLPIFSPIFLIPIFEQFMERFVGNIVATRWGIGLHYSAPLAPILAYASIKTLEKDFFKKRKRVYFLVSFVLLFVAFSYQLFLNLPLNLTLNKDFYKMPKDRPQLEKAIDLIDKKASVATQNNLVPHLSHREKVFVFSSCVGVPDPSRGMFCETLIDKTNGRLPLIEEENVDFILLNFSPGQNPNNFFPDGQEKVKEYVQKLLLDKKYKIKLRQGEIFLLERI